MADPVLTTPTLPAGILNKYLHRAPPKASTYTSAIDTAAAAVVWTAPIFKRANFAAGGYPTDPTLATPALPTGIHHTVEYAAIADATFKASVTTAQNAVVWPAPGYPHANFAAGGYP